MLVTNCLDLYDIKITEELQKKFTGIENTNWQYFPTDLETIFTKAKSNLGDSIFPLYNVFRLGVADRQEGITSIQNYRRDYILSDEKSINYLNCTLRYQIDFFSSKMKYMNLSNIDWYKFQTDAELEFDFQNVGLDLGVDANGNQCKYSVQTIFEDIADNSDLGGIFNLGRFYRYTYTILCEVLIFNIVDNFTYDTIVFNIYNENENTGNTDLLYTKEITD